jgi:hypothetical protein
MLPQATAAVFLAGLTPASRPAMRGALKILAEIATGNPVVEIAQFPWAALRFQHRQQDAAGLESGLEAGPDAGRGSIKAIFESPANDGTIAHALPLQLVEGR